MSSRPFWDNQPVCDASNDRIHLPGGFVWSDDIEMNEIYEFLLKNYIRDDHFEFKYSLEFIEWATDPTWRICICENNKIVGFISGIEMYMRVEHDVKKVIQMNFLCVDETMRSKRFAPLLISEIRRIANTRGIDEGVFTAVHDIPGSNSFSSTKNGSFDLVSITTAKYWHRLIDVKILNKALFSNADPNKNSVTGKSNFRKMLRKDVPFVVNILKKYCSRFKVSPKITKEYVQKWLMPRDGIIYSYINDETKQFVSFYSVPYASSKTGIEINQAYCFYNTPGSFNDSVILAKNAGFHVYNCLNVGVSNEDLLACKFMEGSGKNQYYFYNWDVGSIDREDMMFRIT